MIMWSRVILLAIMVIGAFLIDRTLSQRRDESRQAGATPRRLADLMPELPQLTEVRVTNGQGHELAFSNGVDGMWRCISLNGAPASVNGLQQFVTTMLTAEGFVRSTEPSLAREYGVEGPTALRVTLHGPGAIKAAGSDVLLTVDIGNGLAEADQCFARPVLGSEEEGIWVLDSDLRSLLAPPGGPGAVTVPPLVDPKIIPAVWPGHQGLPRRIDIVRDGHPSLRLLRHDHEPPAAKEGVGDGPPWSWTLNDETGDSHPIEMEVAMSYVMHLLGAPFSGVVDGETATGLALDKPRVRVLLHPDEGPALELRVLDAQPWGVPVFNSFTRVVYAVSPDVADLMAPDKEELGRGAAENPWMRPGR